MWMSENNIDMKILPVLLTAAYACKDKYVLCRSMYIPTPAAAAPHRHCRPSVLPYCRATSSQYIQSVFIIWHHLTFLS